MQKMMILTVAIFMLESHAPLKTGWLVQSKVFQVPSMPFDRNVL